MGGGKQLKASEQRQQQISQQQQQIGQYYTDQSKAALAQQQQLQAPVINYYTQLASGDPSKIMAASAVPLANLAKMTQQARGNIMEMAPGASRTAALAQLGREAAGQQSTMLNQAYLSSFPALQGAATQSGAQALQEAGAGLGGIQSAANTNAQVMQAQQQEKASQMGLIGGIAGAAGNILSGGMSGGLLAALGKKKQSIPSMSGETSLAYLPAFNQPPSSGQVNLGPFFMPQTGYGSAPTISGSPVNLG